MSIIGLQSIEHIAGILNRQFLMRRDIAELLKMVEQRECDLHSVISPGFGEAVASNHLSVSSVWKSLVASCCVWLKFERAFANHALVSSTKVFVSRAKCVRLPPCRVESVRLQHKTR